MKRQFINMAMVLALLFPAKVHAMPETISVHTSDVLTEITMDEFDMISNVVAAEAGNQDWEAQVYVACVILNRVESEEFPNTVSEIIFQSNPQQFCCVWDGGYERAVPTDAIYEAVQYVLDEYRIPRNVLFFTSNGYLKGYKPYTKIADMYFSVLEEQE